jgi:hypothetical protein
VEGGEEEVGCEGDSRGAVAVDMHLLKRYQHTFEK